MEASSSSSQPRLEAYAAGRGLHHRADSFALPAATQLLRHGFMREVPSLATGDLPGGLGEGWLAQVDYVYQGTNDLGRRFFTLVLVQAPETLGFVRVLCHDRGLSDRDVSNPDSDREVVELNDRMVRLESEALLQRYALSTDHDQDQLAVWQLFDPTLIQWLTDDAPRGFSFELQDGALCCFVPGTTADPVELDALCDAAGRVFEHVAEIADHAAAGEPVAGDSRRSIVDGELAEHPFDAPPESVKSAAKAFRRGPLLGDRAWKLGAEAFFREHAKSIGFRPMEPREFRASHLDTAMPGVIAHVATGRLAEADVETYLILTNDSALEGLGWSVLLAAVDSAAVGFAISGGHPTRADKPGVLSVATDGRSLFVSTLDGGARDRKAEELQGFLRRGAPIIAQLG